jgi:hypothetical protein
MHFHDDYHNNDASIKNDVHYQRIYYYAHNKTDNSPSSPYKSNSPSYSQSTPTLKQYNISKRSKIKDTQIQTPKTILYAPTSISATLLLVGHNIHTASISTCRLVNQPLMMCSASLRSTISRRLFVNGGLAFIEIN